MACNESTRVRCGEPAPEPEPRVVANIIEQILVVVVVVVVALVFNFLQHLFFTEPVTLGVLLAAVAVFAIIFDFALGLQHCSTAPDGENVCVAGVVSNMSLPFDDGIHELFPAKISPPRIDIVVKSEYWPILESNRSFVFCTSEAAPRNSAAIRCYYKSEAVCNVIIGGTVGAAIGGIAGLFAALAIMTAASCAVFILCVFAILLAVLVAAVAALVGALIGGQIGKAASGDILEGDDESNEINVGDLISIQGNMIQRDEDQKANVIWWVRQSIVSGVLPNTAASNPYSHCDVDEFFVEDSCPIS